MDNNEVKLKIENVLTEYMERNETAKFALMGFCACKLNLICDTSSREISKTIAENIVSAGKELKCEFLELINKLDMSVYDKLGLRVCDNCGKFMNKGYYLGGEFACSETCGVYIYMKDCDVDDYNEALELMQNDLSFDDEYCAGECYYTEW